MQSFDYIEGELYAFFNWNIYLVLSESPHIDICLPLEEYSTFFDMTKVYISFLKHTNLLGNLSMYKSCERHPIYKFIEFTEMIQKPHKEEKKIMLLQVFQYMRTRNKYNPIYHKKK